MPDGSGILIILFAAVFLFIIIGAVMRYAKNEKSPVIATKAVIIDKKSDIHTSIDANDIMNTYETLYLHIKLDTGSEMRFTVGGRVYRNAVLNEWGTLTFQGTRFLKFESKSGIIEK